MRRSIVLMREFSIPLLLGLALAMVWANVSPGTYDEFIHGHYLWGTSVHFLTNDVFMAFFFGLAAVEITQSCLPGGDLNPPRKAITPLFATVGGVVGPILVYLILNKFVGSPEFRNGWGIPTATDIALAWLAGRAVFGERHPAVSFLLLLAIADDAIGLVIIALFYGDPAVPVAPAWLLLTVAGMACAYLFRRNNVRSYWPYVVAGGGLAWTGLLNAHMHPALALVFVIPFLPHGGKGDGFFLEKAENPHSPLAAFEHDWKAFVDFGLFAFGLVNGGVTIAAAGVPTFLVFFSILIGKISGITAFSAVALRLGYRLPNGMGMKEVVVVSLAAAVGLTVALFVASEAFTDSTTVGAAKMGALASGLIAPVVIIAGKLLRVGRFSRLK